MSPPSQLASLHHIALKVRDLDACAMFYQQVLGLPVLRTQQDESGTKRSVWLHLESGILMLEKQDTVASAAADSTAGWHLLALTISTASRAPWKDYLARQEILIEQETDYSLYFRDPEGNRVALSHYPDST